MKNSKLAVFISLLLMLTFSNSKLILSQDQTEKKFVEFELEPIVLFSYEEQAQIFGGNNIEFTLLIKDKAEKILFELPTPLKKIHYEGLVSSHPERVKTVKHLNDMVNIRTLLWAYLLTNESKYLIKSREYIFSWCNNYIPNGNDVNEGKLIPVFEAHFYLKSHFSESEKIIVEDFIKNIAVQQISEAETNRKSGNRAAKRAMIVLLAGIVLENETFVKWAIEKYHSVLENSFYPDGKSWDLLRRDALHYHVAGIINMLEFVQLAKLLKYDLYNLENSVGGSLQKSIEFILPYVNKKLEYFEWVNSTIELDKRRWEEGDIFYKPGKIWDPKESSKLFLLSSLSNSRFITIAENLSDETDRKSLFYFQIKNKFENKN